MQKTISRTAQRPFTTSVPRSRLVVVAVKPTKAADFRSLSEPEILNKLGSLRTELASVRFLQRTRGISEVKPGEQQNPDPEKVPKANLNKHLKKQVAQLMTILRERQIKEGITRKEALQIERAVALSSGRAL
ncbi:hypothetical protein CEUSTIGMA_g2660.t1 [Chlamydomonas eustigma]|uniref:Ribosomal protein L29 n=1 Tax=Chlamydomonas eustigma TaxID=1157962 RepID=A0A250WWR8_9CHLO|nr:hypothetical protein CEUSTIGMA_g2660.t1 [Chlamydomonas eustigma]|eukprot:GAX75216.1 hypothetical protein CEUSTIGMA_g2660.t1 [Chlamydomonas eustigma]